jgi:hypothetical protein
MKRTKWNPRKVLIASAGVASVNYALATGCSESRPTVANLVIPTTPSGAGGASVANLVAPPSGGTFNPPDDGRGGYAGASVANLVAPPPGGSFNVPDASPPPSGPPDAAPDAAADAAVDGAA